MNFDSIFELQFNSDKQLSIPIFLCIKHAELINDCPIASEEFTKHLSEWIRDNWSTITHEHKCFINKADNSIIDFPYYCKESANALVELLEGTIGRDHQQRGH